MEVRLRVPMMAALLLVVVTSTGSAQVLPMPHRSERDLELQQYTADGLRDYTAMLNDWADAVRRGDGRAAARFYTDDATLRLADGTEIVGRLSIDNYLQENVRPGGDVQMGVTDFAVGGNLGYAMGRYVMRPDASHPATSSAGIYVAVLRRAGKAWRIRALVFAPDPGSATAGA
jgi:ketosteroid isomerase-like protein